MTGRGAQSRRTCRSIGYFEWIKIDDPEARFDAVLAVVNEGNGPGGSVQTHRDGYVAWTPEALAAVQAAAAGS